jgi:DNA modification methylase
VITVGGAVVYVGDCREQLKHLADNSVDSVVTDPPYELGFMGKSWDSTGIAYDVTVWEECLRVLKPGGHILAFGGSRTWHRLAVAVEDAGFELRDSIAWIYGSGFPKSLDVSKAIDKKAGAEREPDKYTGQQSNNLNNVLAVRMIGWAGGSNENGIRL